MSTTKAKAKTPPESYKGHRAGSRKAIIRELFDREGPEVAWTRGLREKLSVNTLRTWFSFWRAQDGTPPVKKKAVTVTTKPKAKVTAPKKKNKTKATNSAGETQTTPDDGASASA